MSVKQVYVHHENLKKRKYNEKVMAVKKWPLITPTVFNATGGWGMEKEASKFLKGHADKLAIKQSAPNLKMVSFVWKLIDPTKTISVAVYK